jgi:hypothetical protein
LTIDDEEDGIPADSETNVDDEDLLCVVLHRGGNPDETSKQDENANRE